MSVARAVINRRARLLFLPIYVLLLLSVIGVYLSRKYGFDMILLVSAIGFIAALIAGLAAYFVGFIRCPNCHENLMALLYQRGGLSLDVKAKYCPFCNASFDADRSS